MIRLALCAMAALVAASVVDTGSGAKAQGFRWFEDGPSRSERVYRERRDVEDDARFQRRMRYYSRDEVARREGARRGHDRPEVVEREDGGLNFFQRLFGGGREREVRADPGAVEVRPPPRRPRRRPPPPAIGGVPPGAPQPAIAGVPPIPGDPAAMAPVPAAPVPPTTFVTVIGDSVADGLAGGLEEGFSDAPELQVKRLAKPNAGLVRQDYFDFVAEAEKVVEAGPVTYAVFEMGVNDRQPFIDMRREPPLSEAWTKRYADRLDALLTVFKERKIPIYWVGLAPSGSRKASADHTAINALAKERVEAAGGTYVDVWEGFVDEDGAYAEYGPQLDGQTGRLRLDDGVHFSKAGSRKLAHYVEQEIRKVFTPKPAAPDAVMAAVAPDGGGGAPQPGPAAEKPRPVSSPVLVLTAPRRAPGASADSAPLTIPARDASTSAARVLVGGEAPDADAGRMDDHRWPGAEPVKLDKAEPPKVASEAPRADAKPSPPSPSLIDPKPTAEQGRLGR